jgi:chemotaxis signal transduction protein
MEDELRASIVKIAGQLFAIEIKYIREILPMPKLTRLPNVEPQFCGVFNLRGRIIPLIDVAPVLGLPNQALSQTAFVAVCEVNGRNAGILTEKVQEMRSIEVELLHVPDNNVQEKLLPFISAVYKAAKSEPIYILDMGALFESAELNKYRFE